MDYQGFSPGLGQKKVTIAHYFGGSMVRGPFSHEPQAGVSSAGDAGLAVPVPSVPDYLFRYAKAKA
jgi:hypothetical protein